jgi:hypothetical protein
VWPDGLSQRKIPIIPSRIEAEAYMACNAVLQPTAPLRISKQLHKININKQISSAFPSQRKAAVLRTRKLLHIVHHSA